MEDKNERVSASLKKWREQSKQMKDAIENDDWELYKKAWGNYIQDDYHEDFVRVMFETRKLEHKGATPHEVFTAQLTGLLQLAVKYDMDLSRIFKELSEIINKRLNEEG
jgi:hypothetical protein